MKKSLENPHESVLCAETEVLGRILWYLVRSDQTLYELSVSTDERRVSRLTPFGDEVGGDAIHWWVFCKEKDHVRLERETRKALEAAQSLKVSSSALLDLAPDTYDDLLAKLRGFAIENVEQTRMLLAYVEWLHGVDSLAPSMLFAYRVWGSTRRSDRCTGLKVYALDQEGPDVVHLLTETAVGLRSGNGIAAWDRVEFELWEEECERSPDSEGVIEIPSDEIVRRTAHRVFREFAVFFEFIRNSVQNVLLDVAKHASQSRLLTSERFWRQFILSAVRSGRVEDQHWDFKETLSIWETKGEARDKAKRTFGEDVAGFANAKGGVLVVGITDAKEIVGIKGDVESRLKDVRDVLDSHLDYPRDIVRLQQTAVSVDGRDALCLVIAVAKAREAVGVDDGKHQFSYPVRNETGLSRRTRLDVLDTKTHLKSDSFDFIEVLEQFVKEQ